MTSSNVHCSATESKLTDSLAFRIIVTALFVAVAFAITGCSGSFDPKLSGGEPGTGVATATFKGHIQGGQAPIYLANVYVFQTTEGGYPAPGIAGNGSLIYTSGTGTYNGAVNGNNYGAHVLTDSNGNFSFQLNDCTPGAGVYIVSYGGQPIYGTPNVAAAEMASMGVCPATKSAGLFLQTPYVNVTEVSTVALAYAVAGFTAAGYDFTHISTSATNVQGMNNAFNLAQQLFSVSTTGGANTSSATMPGATFPAAKINTMANILADCINSAGVTGSSSPCYTLFQNATSNGVAGSGTVPGDTISALINITHNVQSNVSAIYALASNSYAPYGPTLTATPPDFVMAILYRASGMNDPYQIAIDSTGAVYALSLYAPTGNYAPSITKISQSAGVIGTVTLPTYASIAIDQSNNVFLVNQDTNSPVVSEFSSNATSVLGSAVSGAPTFPGASALGSQSSFSTSEPIILIGPSNNVILNDGYSIYSSTYSGGTYGTGAKISNAYASLTPGIAVNGLGTLWFSAYSYSQELTLNTSNTSTNVNLGGANPQYVAVDALGRGWVFGVNGSPQIGALWIMNSAGTAYIASAGLGSIIIDNTSNSQGPTAPAIDGLGTVWVVNQYPSVCRAVSFSTTGAANYTNYGVYVDGAVGAGSCNSNNVSLSDINQSIDQGGNLWVPVRTTSNYAISGYMSEMLGIAAPTIEPLSLQSKKLLPSNTSYDIRP